MSAALAARVLGLVDLTRLERPDDAAAIDALADSMMGPRWVAPGRFRFGAGGLVDDVLARLA